MRISNANIQLEKHDLLEQWWLKCELTAPRTKAANGALFLYIQNQMGDQWDDDHHTIVRSLENRIRGFPVRICSPTISQNCDHHHHPTDLLFSFVCKEKVYCWHLYLSLLLIYILTASGQINHDFLVEYSCQKFTIIRLHETTYIQKKNQN